MTLEAVYPAPMTARIIDGRALAKRVKVEQDEFADWSTADLQAYAETGEHPNRKALGRLNGGSNGRGNGHVRH